MKVVISTAGRFHLFALARELERRNALERIYSGFIWSVLAREGVSRAKVTTLPWFRAPYMAMNRLPFRVPGLLAQWVERMSCTVQDAYVARHLPDCDVFVGHDGAGLNSGKEARRRGYRYIADTGTSHVRFRRELLREEFLGYGTEYPGSDDIIFERQLEEYNSADVIVVPSTFAKQSFVHEGISETKLHRIPYGVSTNHFSQVSFPPKDSFRVLFVGNFSVRKGARYLLEAFRAFSHPKKELIVVGSIEQQVRQFIRRYDELNIQFLGEVSHVLLAKIYSSCHAFVLPSVEEGFGMVMAEALACGCPVIASANTGAPDLIEHGKEGYIVPIRNHRAIQECLGQLADDPETWRRMSAAAIRRIEEIGGWTSYGDKYTQLLDNLRA